MEKHTEYILTVKELCKYYGDGNSRVCALDHLSFEVGSSQLVAVLGNSGSGKSTLLNMLGGMDRFDSGSVCFDGVELGRMSDRELTTYRRNTVGFVFQSFNLISGLTAIENVKLTADPESHGAAEDALCLVGLSDKMRRYPSQLSGGQQQRVSIARAIAKNPKFFLCDEPTGALDTKTGAQVLNILRELNRIGTTVILITHDNGIAAQAHRLVRLQDGKIIEDSPTQEVRT